MRDEYEVLGLLVDADAAAGEPQTFTMGYASFQKRYIAGHPGWGENWLVPSEHEVDELEERGWVRVGKRNGNERQFAVTSKGRSIISRRRTQASLPPGPAVDLSWGVAGPVLGRMIEAYAEAGAPDHGIEVAPLVAAAKDPASLRAAIRELVRAELLSPTLDVEQIDELTHVRPTTDALRLEAGWPAGPPDAAVSALVEALTARIGELPEQSSERSALVKVRDGLAGHARDFLVAYLATLTPRI